MKQPLGYRLDRWFSEHLDGLTRLRLLLLLLVLWCMGRGLVLSSRFAGSGLLTLTILLAVLFGWLLARSRSAGWKCTLLAVVIGPLWSLLTVGGLGAPLFKLIGAYPPLLLSLLRPPHIPDVAPLLTALSSLGEQAGTLYARFELWFGSLTIKSFAGDPVVEGIFWGLAAWIVSCWAAFWLRRKSQVELALLPGAVLLVVTVFYSGGKNSLLWLVLVAGGWILIQALEHYAASRLRWQAQKMDRVEIEPALTGAVTFLAVTAMLAGGFLPGISFEKIIDTLQEVFQSESVSGTAGEDGSPGGSPGYTTALRIGAGQELPKDIVLYITVEGYTPPDPSERGRFAEYSEPETQFYWRSLTYSTYNGRGWSNYTDREESFDADAPLYPDLEPVPGTYEIVRQYVERLNPFDEALYAAGELLRVDQPYTVAFRRSGDPSGAQTQADSYTAESRLLVVPVEQLRQSGSDYPAIIRARYLQLPDELPDRLFDLALDLTVNYDNPYDRAAAIQDYLRQFRYNLDVPAPPPERDAADFFLFDLQQGYCNYYATSMAVLSRTVGIPSRLVTGYRTGSYDFSSGHFIIREENLHAWVEIYFAGIGWVEFEPTSGVSLFPRRGGDETAARPPETVPSGSGVPVFTRLYWAALRNPLTSAGILLGGALLIFLFVSQLPLRDWSLYLRPPEKALQVIYRRLYRLARRWGIPSDASRTPQEFSLALASRLALVRTAKRSHSSPSSLQSDLQSLTQFYTRLLYSPFRPSQTDGRRLIHTWMRLRRALHRLHPAR